MQESPLCDLIPMKNNDKAYTWSCNDCSEEAKIEKLAARLQTVESKPTHLLMLMIDATKFKEAFEAATKFNQLLKDGKTEELVFAAAVEDLEEIPDPADDPDKNKTADEEGAVGGDDEWIKKVSV